MRVFVGHDWAEAHHDVFIVDGAGGRLAAVRVPEGVTGVARVHALIADHIEDPSEVTVATETDRGLFVGAMVAAGYRVLAVNPMSVARYRERHVTSGAKSDAGDAWVLAELARVDGHHHPPISGDTELGDAVKALARAHQSMIWSRQRHTLQLRSALREFYPAALEVFDDLASKDALAVLAIAPTPKAGRRLSSPRIVSALRRGGRQRRLDERAGEIKAALRAEHLQTAGVIADAMGATVAALVGVIAELVTQIRRLEAELADHFEQHLDAKIIRSLPGLGTILGARGSPSSGTTRTGSTAPSLARTTPPRHRSPAPQANTESCWPDTPATGVSPTPATSGPSPPSPPAPGHEPSTTTGDNPATPTTRRSAPSPTASSASSTAASATTPPTTNTPPGPTATTKPLDSYTRGMSTRPRPESQRVRPGTRRVPAESRRGPCCVVCPGAPAPGRIPPTR